MHLLQLSLENINYMGFSEMDEGASTHMSLPRVRILSLGEKLVNSTSDSEYSFEVVFMGIDEKGLIPLTILRRCGDESQMLLMLAERAALLIFYRIEDSLGHQNSGNVLR